MFTYDEADLAHFVEDDVDDFEDAQEEQKTVDLESKMVAIKTCVIQDLNEERLALPTVRDCSLKSGTFWAILKDMVGKDITKYSMPVIVNEPLSNLQKSCELFSFNYLLEEACK